MPRSRQDHIDSMKAANAGLKTNARAHAASPAPGPASTRTKIARVRHDNELRGDVVASSQAARFAGANQEYAQAHMQQHADTVTVHQHQRLGHAVAEHVRTLHTPAGSVGQSKGWSDFARIQAKRR